jgi:hypothetical protein
MYRFVTLAALAATLVLTAVIDMAVRANTSGLFASSLAPWPTWLGMTATIGLTAGFAYLALRWSPPDLGLSFVIIAVGAIVGYGWPIAYSLGIIVPDFVTEALAGPTLLAWQGLLLSVVGVAAMVRGLQSRRA